MPSKFNKLATTAIGSMPGDAVQGTLALASTLTWPFFPTFPKQSAEEGMVLEGLGSGLPAHYTQRGADWLAAFPKESFSTLKIQLVGPVTLLLSDPERKNLNEEERRAWIESKSADLVDRARAMVAWLKASGHGVVFFVDEPMFSRMDLRRRGDRAAFKELHLMLEGLREQGAGIGVHCCDAPDFDKLCGITPDWISFDAFQFQGAMLESAETLVDYFGARGSLALGVIPTEIPSAWETKREVERLRRTFASLPFATPEAGQQALASCLLTPACGLGTKTIGQAQAVFAALNDFQRELL